MALTPVGIAPVACFAADGHITVEAGHAGVCSTEWVRHHGADRPHIDADVCDAHDCRDVPLVGPSALRSVAREPATAPVVPTVAPAAVARLGAVVSLAWSTTPPRPPAALRARRTVVLLS